MIKAPLTAENRSIRRIALGDYVPRIARENPDRLAVIDGPQRLTYGDLDRASNRAAHALLATVPQGAQIGMLCANSAEMIIAINGIHKAGHIWVPVNVMLDGGQIDYILRHAEVSAVIVDEPVARLPHIAAVLNALGVPVLLTRATNPAGDGEALLADLMARQPETAPDITIDSDQVAFVMYTSGTTGHPKGVMHSHASVAAGVAANLTTFGFNAQDVMSCVLPLFHVGQHCVVASALAIGACVVVTRGFVPGDMVDQVVGERFTVFVGLPMMYGAMLADPKGASADFSNLRLCIYAMAPMPRTLVDRIAARMTPNIMLATGQTEIYPVTMSFSPVQHPGRDANYWGQSTTACETAIMDDFGTILPHGQVGEIVHRGANVMLGYFKDPEATAASQRFGWHHTGDLGVIDEGGQLLFLDRKKDMIKTGGENVASIKVETALLSHPAVATAAVVGLPHVHWSEAIAAFVTRKPGMTCSDEELLAHCRERLGRFEVPKAITWLDAMPMTATGKVQKHMLRKQYEALFEGVTA